MFVENWKESYKWLSMYAFVIIGLLPDIFNLAITTGVLEAESAPATLNYTIKVVAFLGAVGRLVKQTADAQKLNIE
jgi:hypothetical protein